MVNADAQNLDIPFRKLGLLSFVRRNLAGSNRGPGFGEESDHRDFASLAKIAQADLLLHVAFQLKIRCYIADL